MEFINTVSAWFDYPAFVGRLLALCFVWHLLPGENSFLGFILSFITAAGLGLVEAKMNTDLQTESEFEDDDDWENKHV
jgi:hypothetical protein